MITKESVGSFDWKVSLGERVLTKEEFEAVMAHVEPDLTAEDFGFYLQKVPGAFLWLGCSTPGTPAAGLHNARCCPDEKALEVGSRLMAGVAIKALAALSADHDFFQKDGSLS